MKLQWTKNVKKCSPVAAVGIKSNWAVKADISAFNSSHKMYFFKSSASSISDYRGKIE